MDHTIPSGRTRGGLPNATPLSTPVKTAKNLGVIFDDGLTFDAQVNRTVGTCFCILRILRKALPLIPSELHRPIIIALITSRLDCCNALYLNISTASLNKLQAVQNAAARLILKIPKFQSGREGICTLHWLPIKERISFKVLSTVYKAMHSKGSSQLKSLFQWYIPGRSLRSSTQNKLVSPRFCRSRWGGRSFSVAAARLWNSLPLAIVNACSLPAFKKLLKTWLYPS